MDNTLEELNNGITQDATGSISIPTSSKIFYYPFGKYVIEVNLTEDNKFIGISEIKVNKNFLDYKQKLTPRGIHDVDEYYRE